jgi:hypothetical protein
MQLLKGYPRCPGAQMQHAPAAYSRSRSRPACQAQPSQGWDWNTDPSEEPQTPSSSGRGWQPQQQQRSPGQPPRGGFRGSGRGRAGRSSMVRIARHRGTVTHALRDWGGDLAIHETPQASKQAMALVAEVFNASDLTAV